MIVTDASGQVRELRWTAKRKARVVLQVLAGAPIDQVARVHELDVADLVIWRDRYMDAGELGLKAAPRTQRVRP